MLTEEFIERFHAKWKRDRKTGCWNWTASIAGKGYGQIKIPGTRKQMYAHRLSWLIHNGDIPEGQFILHVCDNVRCVNPEHLFLGDASKNANDMKAKKRHLYGELNSKHRLTKQDVREIRAMLSMGVRQRRIAAAYEISQIEVSRINTRQRWAHVK